MTNLTAIILGIIEGATEFIPVSSTGHLILVRQALGINDAMGLSFDAVLQLSATLALIVYFWRDILSIHKNKVYLYAIILGTIPAVLFGFLLEDTMDTLFRNVNLVAITLIMGSILFWYADKYKKENKILTLGRGVAIGFFQCLALIPGISRSGATISGGLISGLSQDEAIRFSFLLSIPILVGSGLKKLFEIRNDIFFYDIGSALALGSLFAFIVGLLSINFLIKYLRDHNLTIFIWYRVILAIAIIIFL